ncbi:hypothetical protein J3B02_005665 [Coemansia erecta]|uniref:Lipid droplet-associated hydrolase n=1 Tax=Coemansia asiatica TaxID=1052880 RepID=A0A9W7XQ84_9FUNG|nr:hypothetical protein LPJ64_001332 [Coemansia asiatica]KAJ2842147.1 hypothetical protein J3B02_005665 [Coemansia erecta]
MSFSNNVFVPQRTCWTVGGELRETLFWPNQSTVPPKAVMLLIPGNPGLVDFYVDFCTTLHKEFPDMDIIGVSHLGHTRFSDNRGLIYRCKKTHSLEEQAMNMIEVFDEIDREYAATSARPKMLLLGHSVGCYFAQKIVECREHRVDRVYSLFPAIESIADTPRGRQLRLLFQPGFRQLVAGMVETLRWLLPVSTIYRFAQMSGSLNHENAQLVVDKMLFGSCIRSILKMASDEMRVIGGLDEELYSRIGGKFVMYYGVGDEWVPVSYYHRMRDVNVDGTVFLCKEGISHAFVTNYSTQMARVVVEMLKQEFA